MVRALDSERAVWVWALAGNTVLCSWARHLTLTVPLSIQEYKWVLANCWGNLTNCGGVTCNGLASYPGGLEILLASSCYRNQDKLWQLWAISSKASLMHICTECMINMCCVQCLCCREDTDVTASSTNVDITGISASYWTYKKVLFTRYGLF